MTRQPSPEVVVIAALTTPGRVIGDRGRLPWSIPADLARFKQLTWGHTVVVGRRTWEHDLQQRPLPGRQMVVLSRSAPPQASSLESSVQWCANVSDLLTWPCERLFIAGGGQIYAQTLAIAQRWELTLIDHPYAGDTLFPDYQQYPQFCCVSREPQTGYCFTRWQRNP